MQKVSSSRLAPVWPSHVIRNGQKICQSLAEVLKAWDPRSYHRLVGARSTTVRPAGAAFSHTACLSCPLPVWSCRLLSFQSLPSAPPTVLACTVSSLTSQSATCSGTAGTAKPVAISAPLDWRMTARRASACGQTRCQNARLKVGIATRKCHRSLRWRGYSYWWIKFSGTAADFWKPRRAFIITADTNLPGMFISECDYDIQ